MKTGHKQNDDDQSQTAYALQLAAECRQVGMALARKGVKTRYLVVTTRAVAALVGIGAILAAYVQPIRDTIGDGGVTAVTLIAAITLIVTTIVGFLTDRYPPERFEDYAKYVMGYESRIKETLSKQNIISKSAFSAALDEIQRLANKNLEDTRSRWPWVDDDGKAS